LADKASEVDDNLEELRAAFPDRPLALCLLDPALREAEASEIPSSSENIASIRLFFFRATLTILGVEAEGIASVDEGSFPLFFACGAV